MDILAHLPLATGDVVLRQLTSADAQDYAAGTEDPTVRAYAHLPEPRYTPELVRAQLASVITPGLVAGNLALLAVADATDDTFLGSVVLFDITPTDAEVGFWLAPAARGRGAAVEAVRGAVRLAAALGLTRLHARTDTANAASARTLARAQFVPRGEPARGTTPSGETALMRSYVREL